MSTTLADQIEAHENEGQPEILHVEEPTPTSKRRPLMIGIVALLVIGAAIKGYGAYSFGQSHVETDNAYVTGDLVNISPTVSGTLAELKVADGDFVHKGQLIARLDTDSSQSLLNQAQANLVAAESQVPQAEAQLQYTKLSTDASIRSSQAAVATQVAKTQGSRMQVQLSSDTVHNQILQAQGQQEQAKALAAQAEAGVNEAKAALASAKLSVQNAGQNAEAASSNEQSAKAEATRADKDLKRYQLLFKEEAISQQQLDSATANATSSAAAYSAATQHTAAANSQVEVTKSAVTQAESRLNAAISQSEAAQKEVQVAQAGVGLAQAGGTQIGIQNSNVATNVGQTSEADAAVDTAKAGVEQVALREKQVASAKAQLAQAQAAVENAKIQVQNASLFAPCDGYVVKHNANVGTAINPGQTIVTITHGTDVWVMANFKETQLAHVREGQEVEMEVDAYPGKAFRGKVLDILEATGSATTLLPPDNSTGNFTKVVQRVPVKISIEQPSDGPRLRQGMSVDATITTSKE